MKELIFNSNPEKEPSLDYKKIYKRCLIDLSEELSSPPTALGIGYHDYRGTNYLNNTFSYGEFSAIVAASKSKKTFFKSSLIAAYIGGQTVDYFSNMVSRREGEPFIIDIDTEQGEYYAQRAFRRVADMVGETYNNYLPFGLEELDSKEIVSFIESLLNDPQHKGKIKWMSIDGVADLVDNPNDIGESVAVMKRLKLWRKQNQMHINTVIHKTSTSDKATGHLGSYIQKKAETVILLKDTIEDHNVRNSPIQVDQLYSRGAPFDPFFFRLDNKTLPYECEKTDLENWDL